MTTTSHHAPDHAAAAAAVRRRGVPRLWDFASEYLLLLPLGAAIALAWANIWPDSYFRTSFALAFFVNDVAMVLFFGLIMKEVAEAAAPGGVLHPWRRATLPLVAAIGLTLVPVAAYALVAPQFDEPRVLEGWPVVFATDLAFGYFVARVIFGRHPVVPLFVLLAICANAFGIVALAAAGERAHLQLGVGVALMVAAIAAAGILRRRRERSFWPYILLAGGLSWSALYFGGLEPALALVPIVPFLPHAARDPGFFVDATPEARDTLSRFELWSRHPAQIALFLFGLVNGGVQFGALYWGTWSLPAAVVIAKPVGLLLGVAFALAVGLHLPRHVGWRDLVVVGFISTIGFTVALFFATAVIGPGQVLSEVKMGALLSLGGGILAILAAALLKTGKFAKAGRFAH
jgi:Na+:H+ antiporter, NhaA family